MRRLASRVFPVLKSIGLICAICFPPAAFAQVRYHITRIPTAQGANSVALGINNKGEVVGYSFQGEDYQAFVYSSSDQTFKDVGSLGGKINAACAISVRSINAASVYSRSLSMLLSLAAKAAIWTRQGQSTLTAEAPRLTAL